jgi:crotonobetainyl-CoA:carnitine CoA-transferase CaiB-like acyl-CoA transferase
LRVLDLSRVLAGPLCAQYLGDMGADVIKVEDTQGGDESRSWPVFRTGLQGDRTSAVFHSVNRNKRDLAMDLKSERARAIVHALVKQSDVVIESFAPGVAERLGVDAATLMALNPRLIHCSITGFGTQGPLKHGKGYDLILQAFSGMLSITGDVNSPPTRSPFSPVDQGTGLHALIGILAALWRRQTTGAGGSVEASLFDTSTAFLGYFLQNHWETGAEPVKAGVGHGALCPYGLFDTADRPIIIGVANDVLWGRFCKITGLDQEPGIESLATNGQRVERRAETEALVSAALRRQGRGHWFAELDAAGIPCSPLHTLGEFSQHEHARASGMIFNYEDPHFGTMNGVSQPLRFDGERPALRRHPPLHGEHTQAILQELGLPAREIDELIHTGVVHTVSASGASS